MDLDRNSFLKVSINLFQDLSDYVDNEGRIDATVIDFSKAFDVLTHDILLQKLDGMGIGKRTVHWV